MAELFLVRHGQASFGTDDYDRLSAAGEQQGVWLGEYFAQQALTFDRVICGTLNRHAQTVDAILRGMGREGAPVDRHRAERIRLPWPVRGRRARLPRHRPPRGRLDEGAFPRAPAGAAALVGRQARRVGPETGRISSSAWPRPARPSATAAASACWRWLRRPDRGHRAAGAGRAAVERDRAEPADPQQQPFAVFFNAEAFHLASFNGIPHLEDPERHALRTYG